MSENTIVGSSPELAAEITRALESLRKRGYTAQVRDSEQAGICLITFRFGESEQTLEFKNNDWQKSGVVSSAIVEHLNI